MWLTGTARQAAGGPDTRRQSPGNGRPGAGLRQGEKNATAVKFGDPAGTGPSRQKHATAALTGGSSAARPLRKCHWPGYPLVFAELKGPVKDRLRQYGIYESFGPGAFLPTVGRAVAAYVSAHNVPWRDWSE